MYLELSYYCLLIFSYADFRLIDIPKLKSKMPLTLSSFIELVKQSSQHGTHVLRSKWIEECCSIVNDHRDDIESWMPADMVCEINS